MKANKHLILTSLSCIGVVSVAVVSAFDTVRATKKDAKPETVKDYLKTYWKDYIPTVLVSTATVASVIANQKLTSRDLQALGACAASGMLLVNDYKKKIEEHFGKEELNNIVKEIVKEKEINAQQAKEVGISTCHFLTTSEDPSVKGETLFYDEFSDTWFRSSLYSVKNAMYHFNRNFNIAGSIAYEDFYEFLGVTPNKSVGPDIGFDVDMMWNNEMYWIDHDLIPCETDDGEAYYIISLCVLPGKYDEEEGTFVEQEVA